MPQSGPSDDVQIDWDRNKAGSGADVIKTGWNENGWPDPELKEHFGAYSNRVELTLRLGAVSGQNTKWGEK